MILLSYWYGSYVAATGIDSLQIPAAVIAIEYAVAIAVPIIAWAISRYLKAQHLRDPTDR